MSESYDKNTAVVVLPPVSGGRLRDKRLLAWLSQAEITGGGEPRDLLERILSELNLPYPDQGLAALRLWGQTGNRPTNWVAAADPVYLEPRLDHLCLHAGRAVGDDAHLGGLIDHLQATLAPDRDIGFMRLGACGYVSSKEPFATAAVPASVVDQQRPDEFLPGGEGAASHHALQSEIEMALHEHAANEERTSIGLPPINSLWLWGGGHAPQKTTQPQPPLFADDPLLLGYWHAATGVVDSWSGSIAECLEASVAGFVAVIPDSDAESDVLEDCLLELRIALKAGRLSNLRLLFRDGVRAYVNRGHGLRIWRRRSSILEAP